MRTVQSIDDYERRGCFGPIYERNSSLCVCAIAPSRYRNDPYKAKVLGVAHGPRMWTRSANAFSDVVLCGNTSFTSMEEGASNASFAACTGGMSTAPTSPVGTSLTSSPGDASLELVAVAPMAGLTAAPRPPQSLLVRVQLKMRVVVATLDFATLPPQQAARCRHPRNGGAGLGMFVVVSGDRGEDLGQITSAVGSEATGCNDDGVGPTDNICVLRLASSSERETHARLRNVEEPAALSRLLEITREVRFEGTVADVEFQWDHKKLTVYVARPHKKQFVDFRKLQRAAFCAFRCRIWMVYMDELPSS